ncbi:2748_t:CDS:2 [Racocetra fulgida]|uniref:2748_t:CDS:1 n=1 Tax=Racocetra fulgida TaxID=60492 RepID=A0A9N8VJW6_9GLOM|nr:2748_t:CDS:2 [Racocetra fulgida]
MLLNRWKERIHLKRVALSLLVVLCFLIIASDARVLTNSYNEIQPLTVSQVDTYPDDTIIMLLKPITLGSCGDSTLYFRIIAKNGTMTKFDYPTNNGTIPLNNFCFQSSNVRKRNSKEYEEDCDDGSEPKKHPSKPTKNPKHPAGKKDCDDGSENCENDCKQSKEDCEKDCGESDEDCKKRTTPNGPGTTPNGPGTTPNGPGTTPNGPGTTPNGPGTTPNGPGTTPNGPGTTPNGPNGQNGTTPNGPNNEQNGTLPNVTIPIKSNGPGVMIPRSKTSSYSTINIYALSKPFVLVTYYCNYPQSYQIKTDGSITTGASGQSSEITKFTDMSQFSKFINIFPTENNDYGLVYTKYVSQSGQGITSPWQLYLIWISHTDSSTKGNSLIYESQPSTNTTDYYLYQCSVAQESVGYNCLVYTKRTDKTVYVNVNFWSSGSVNKTNEITVNMPAPYTTVVDVGTLSYGGYIFVVKNTTNATDMGNVQGLVYYNNGTDHGTWGLPDFTAGIPIVGVTPNNTVWTITQSTNNTSNSSTIIEIVTNITNFIDLKIPFKSPKKAGMLGSSYISHVTPASNTTIAPRFSEIKITYNNQIYKSNGSFKVWEVNTVGGDDFLRGAIPASHDRVTVNNENVTVKLLPSYMGGSHKEYYITVDDNAIKNAQDQNLIGIKKSVWNLNTCDRSVIIRLTPEGTQHYVDLSSNDRSTFVKNMSGDIATVINCDASRISIPVLYQYSNYNNSGDQIFMRVNIAQNAPSGQSTQGAQGAQGDSRGAPSLAEDLNDVITNKDISAISTGTTSQYIDQPNGAWPIRTFSCYS